MENYNKVVISSWKRDRSRASTIPDWVCENCGGGRHYWNPGDGTHQWIQCPTCKAIMTIKEIDNYDSYQERINKRKV